MSSPDPRPPRRERERLRHRQEILDAALRVVAARGVEGVTVEHVAREAEFAVGSIYRHFRSKDELVTELFTLLVARVLAEMQELAEAPGPFTTRLEQVVQLAYDRHLELLPVLHAFYAAPGPLPDASTDGGRALRELKARHAAILDRLLAAGQEEGAIQPGDRAPLVLALSALVTHFARVEAQREAPSELDGAAEVVRLFLYGAASR